MTGSTGLRRLGSHMPSSQVRGVSVTAGSSALQAPALAPPSLNTSATDRRLTRRTSPRHGPYSHVPGPEPPYLGATAVSSSHGGTESVSQTFSTFRMYSAPDISSSIKATSPLAPLGFRAAVHNVAGDKLDVVMDCNTRNTTVHKLKMHIASLWHVPPAFQQLLHDQVVVEDTDMLASFVRSDGTAGPFTMTLELEQVFAALKSTDNCMRSKAVEQVGILAKGGDNGALGELIDRTKDFDGEVRREAVVALIAVAEGGNERAMQAVCRSVRDSYVTIRTAALRALAKRTRQGGDHTKALVTACVEDHDFVVRAVALELLMTISASHYEKISLMLDDCSTNHRDTESRHAAQYALQTLANHSMDRTRLCGPAVAAC